VALGFRLRARNPASGLQLADAEARPATIRAPAAFRAAHVDGPGTSTCDERRILLAAPRAARGQVYDLPWTDRTARLVA
jgi:hypothetical protein